MKSWLHTAYSAQEVTLVPMHTSTDCGLYVTSGVAASPSSRTQCAAVTIVSEDRIEPPHRKRLSIVSCACQMMLGLPPAVAGFLRALRVSEGRNEPEKKLAARVGARWSLTRW